RCRRVEGFHALPGDATGTGGRAADQTAARSADQPGQLVARIGLVLREGLLVGVIGGLFALLVRLVAVYATHDLPPSMFENFVILFGPILVSSGARPLLTVLHPREPHA